MAAPTEGQPVGNGKIYVVNGVSNHGSNAVEGAFPGKLSNTQSSDGSHAEKRGSVESTRRRSTVAGPALDIVQSVQTVDVHHPIHWAWWKKWLIVATYCMLQVFVTMTSTSYVSIEALVSETFNISSTQVLTLGQSMFIVGNAVGPAFLGPLSDIGGRKWVYVVATACYALLNIGCALPLNFPMLVIFMFLTGVASSVALCNVAGTIADLFGDSDGAAQPMALFVWSSDAGPVLGSPVGEWIAENEWMQAHTGWAWVFWINIIGAVAFAAAICFVPETLPRIVIARAAKNQPETAGANNELAVAQDKVNVLQEIRFVATMALRIMLFEPIVTVLAVYNGFGYGLIFLYLDGVFDVFAINNGLSVIDADLTYFNLLVAVSIMFVFIPVQTWLYKRDRARNGGAGRPEARLLTSLVCVWGYPISLFWFAFTSTGNVSFWSPVAAGVLLGFADPLLYLAMLNYITDAYPNVAASAVAAFLIPSFLGAAAFAHIGVIMFDSLSSQWAVAILAFVSLGLVALVYVIYFFGPWLRRKSKLARTF